MKRKNLQFLMLLILLSCSKKNEVIDRKPLADFTYYDNIDTYSFFNNSTDKDNDKLTCQWKCNYDSVSFNNSVSDNPFMMIPDLAKAKSVNITLTVSDGQFSDSITKGLILPQMILERKYGLGRLFYEGHSNNVNYFWYLDQLNTGTYYSVNCGPTSVTMAIKWVNQDFTKTPQDARNTYRSSGGWWYTSDIVNYLNLYSIHNKTIAMPDVNLLQNELNSGNIAILCLDMYYIRKQEKDKWHVDKFYTANTKGWGHFIVIKGYKNVDDETFFEAYDPYSMGMKYANDTLKGLDRYYRQLDLDSAVLNWWSYAIIVGRNSFKSAGGLDINTIKQQSGR